MNDNRKNVIQGLADFYREVFDANRDGRVNFKDVFSWLPNNAVGAVMLVLDIAVLVAEYRVWDVGMRMTGDPLKAIGFVLVSGIPFYLGQIMWLYPLANGLQQLIAGLFVVLSIVTSATFGFADLSQNYDTPRIAQMVVWLTGAYIFGLILYALSDSRIQAKRLLAQTRAQASFVSEQMEASDKILGTLSVSLGQQDELIAKYGPDAVGAQLNRLRGKKHKDAGKLFPQPQPQPVPIPLPQPRPQPQEQKQYPHWTLDGLCVELNITPDKLKSLTRNMSPDQAYNALKSYGIERVEISRKNFKHIVAEAQAGHPNSH